MMSGVPGYVFYRYEVKVPDDKKQIVSLEDFRSIVELARDLGSDRSQKFVRNPYFGPLPRPFPDAEKGAKSLPTHNLLPLPVSGGGPGG